MAAILSFCIPPIILVIFRNKILKITMSRQTFIVACIISGLGLNLAVNFFVYIGAQLDIIHIGGVFATLNAFPDFVVKYVGLSCLLAILEIFAERIIRGSSPARSLAAKIAGFRYWRAVSAVYAAVLFTLNFIRIFDNDFWCDEAYSIGLIKYSIPELISITGADVHPPLYYLILKAVCSVIGFKGWAFHLVSLIPVGLAIVFCLTSFWKKFGGEAAVILITFMCICDNAVKYNMEVRMYSWGAFFVLMSFWFFFGIICEGETRDYVLFVVFSLAASYTHYYCLVSVAIFYLLLIILMFIKKKTDWKKVLIACGVTIAGYLPWFAVLWQSMTSRIGNYWITEIPGFLRSMSELFSEQLPVWIWISTGFALGFAVLYETGIMRIEKNESGHLAAIFSLKSFHISDELICIAGGILCPVGTILFGIIISELVQPFYSLRYIYPASIVAWAIMGIIISRLRGKKLYAAVFIVWLLVTMIPAYIKTYDYEASADRGNTKTIEMMESEMSDTDVVLIDIGSFYSVAGYYFPGRECDMIDFAELPELDTDTVYWFITSSGTDVEYALDAISEQGFTYEQMTENSVFGYVFTDIYRFTYSKE